MKQIISIQALFFILNLIFISNVSIAAANCYSKVDGSKMANGLEDVSRASGCWSNPAYYDINFYEMRVCSSIPTAPTTSTTFDLTNCPVVLSSPLGGLVEVKDGVSSAIPGTITRPPNGTYTHGFVKVSNIFKIKGDVDFGSSSKLSVPSDRYCVTNTGSQTTNSRINGICSASSGATPGLLTTEKVSFSGGVDVTKTGTRGIAYLLDSNEYLASDTTQAETDFVVQVKELTSPVIFDNSVTNINIVATVKKGMTVSLNSNGTKVRFDIGPFDLDIQVQ